MTRADQNAFLLKARDAAVASGHPWPEYAACEAALESAWGTSKLCLLANNLFGEKQHVRPIFETLEMPTHEVDHGILMPAEAKWVKFPDWATCFKSRIDTVTRLSSDARFAGYAAALKATNGETFVREVSKDWATDPLRAVKVLAIHGAHANVFGLPQPSA